MNYSEDGKCHNSEPGTFNHECGKPANWIGTNANGFKSGFCSECKESGYEARTVVRWETREQAASRAALRAMLDSEDASERRARKDAIDAVRMAAKEAL